MSRQPNILLILTDQHHAGYLGCMGHPHIQTPNLDRFAKQAHVFHSAYTPSPVCGPARVSLFTGRYPLQHGVCRNWIPLQDESTLLTHHLADAGYTNALIGKLHISPVAERHGFHWRRLCDSPHDVYDPDEVVHNAYVPWAAKTLGVSRERVVELAGESEHCGADDLRFWEGWSWMDDAHQITTWTGNEAVDFIEGYDREQPFFLNVSFFGPHHPYATCEPWDSMLDPAELALPETFNRDAPADAGGRRFDWPDETWRRLQAKYCGNISAIDAQVGRMLEALRTSGAWDNTLIVFSSDHGDHMGEFSMLGKSTMLEGSVRIPMIVKPPCAACDGRNRDEVVNLIDLYPTLLDYAGQAHSARSLRPLLDGKAGWENETYSFIGDGGARDDRAMIVRDQWKVIGRIRDGRLTSLLTDRTTSPPDDAYEPVSPDGQGIGPDLHRTLEAWLEEQRALANGNRPSKATGRGKRVNRSSVIGSCCFPEE